MVVTVTDQKAGRPTPAPRTHPRLLQVSTQLPLVRCHPASHGNARRTRKNVAGRNPRLVNVRGQGHPRPGGLTDGRSLTNRITLGNRAKPFQTSLLLEDSHGREARPPRTRGPVEPAQRDRHTEGQTAVIAQRTLLHKRGAEGGDVLSRQNPHGTVHNHPHEPPRRVPTTTGERELGPTARGQGVRVGRDLPSGCGSFHDQGGRLRTRKL